MPAKTADNRYGALRLMRIACAVAVACAVAAGAIWPGSIAAQAAQWLGAAQPVAAICGGALVWVIAWTITALLGGRLYCSFFCPLGTLIDVISRLASGKPFSPVTTYRPTAGRLAIRLAALAVFAEAICLGIAAAIAWMDPYAGFVRIAAMTGTLSAGAWAGGLATLAVAVALTVRGGGRRLCNTGCPVGAALGAAGYVALMRMDINPDLCTHCGKCQDVCKGRCISHTTCTIDTTRCVACFDCAAVCPDGALKWRAGRHRLQWPLMQQISPTAAPSAMTAPAGTVTAGANDTKKQSCCTGHKDIPQ